MGPQTFNRPNETFTRQMHSLVDCHPLGRNRETGLGLSVAALQVAPNSSSRIVLFGTRRDNSVWYGTLHVCRTDVK